MYIETEGNKRRIIVQDMFQKMRKVMSDWLGLGLEEAFAAWKNRTRKTKRRKLRDRRKENRAKRIKYEEEVAKFEIAQKEVSDIILYLKHMLLRIDKY